MDNGRQATSLPHRRYHSVSKYTGSGIGGFLGGLNQMTSRHPLIDFLQRFFQVLRVVLRQLTRVAVRRLRGQPVMGHLLLREAFETVGGSFLKLGQIMSLQVDILPKEYCDALLSLLDRVPTSTREEISAVFVAEFGRPPEELYSEFDHVAMASASIGQVHRARLRDGTAVSAKTRG